MPDTPVEESKVNREELRVIEETTVDVACHLSLIRVWDPLERRRADTPSLSERIYLGQIQPAPLGLGKQPTDCGRSCFGSHSTTSGNSTVKAMVMKNTM